MIYIYTLIDPTTNEVRYVGKTKDKSTRLSNHIFYAKGSNSNRHICNWIRQLLKQDLKPKFIIIEECVAENWAERERYWISHYKSLGFKLTNITIGGDVGSVGYVPSTEQKLKQFASLKKTNESKDAVLNGKKMRYGKTSTLSKEQVLEIRSLLLQGFNTSFVSARFNVHRVTINDIKLGKSWKELGEFNIKGKLRKIMPEQISKIKELLSQGFSQREIQNITGNCRPTINDIKNGKYN